LFAYLFFQYFLFLFFFLSFISNFFNFIGYCLPAEHVLHTVGPIISKGAPLQPELLAKCYTSCLDLCVQNGIDSIAFCCISTGVFGYPQEPAAHVALKAVKKYLETKKNHGMKFVIFNVFTPPDHQIYQKLLPQYFPDKV